LILGSDLLFRLFLRGQPFTPQVCCIARSLSLFGLFQRRLSVVLSVAGFLLQLFALSIGPGLSICLRCLSIEFRSTTILTLLVRLFSLSRLLLCSRPTCFCPSLQPVASLRSCRHFLSRNISTFTCGKYRRFACQLFKALRCLRVTFSGFTISLPPLALLPLGDELLRLRVCRGDSLPYPRTVRLCLRLLELLTNSRG